ncbi:hypothetical protein T484DRAFT_1947925, partial [Baffinella frigidus]
MTPPRARHASRNSPTVRAGIPTDAAAARTDASSERTRTRESPAPAHAWSIMPPAPCRTAVASARAPETVSAAVTAPPHAPRSARSDAVVGGPSSPAWTRRSDPLST